MASYKQVSVSGTPAKGRPGSLYGCICVSDGSIVLRDGLSGADPILYQKSMVQGEVFHLGGVGLAFSYLFFSGTGTFNLILD